MRLIKMLFVLVLIVGAVVAYTRYSDSADSGDATVQKDPGEKKEGVRLEERYGFTGQTIDP